MQRRDFLALAPALLLQLSPLGTEALAEDRDSLHPRAAAQMSARLRVALIGTGWYGKSDLLRLMQVADVEVVGLCDVDRNMLEGADALVRARQPAQRPNLYANHRELLDREKPEIVLIATPDHWHALQAIDAMAAGAHLYLQKPIGVDVRECEAIVAAARTHQRVVQVGLQRRSTPHLLEAKAQFLDSGLIGEIHHVEMCCYYPMRDTAVRETVPVPGTFDYDRWTGPAPLLPYRGLPHRRWRSFEEYGNGIVGDMCVHYLDAVRWLLDLGWPARVSSQGGIYVQTAADATIPDTQTAVFEFPARKLNCVWQHRSWGQAPDPEWPWAFILYGSKGTLKGDTHKYEFTPLEGGRPGQPVRGEALYEREAFPEDLTEEGIELHVASATRAHMRDLLGAIKNGRLPAADIEQGYISTASCVLANLSCELGRPLAYDPVAKVVVNDVEATSRLARTYRTGWGRP